jgi:hypothetical protein
MRAFKVFLLVNGKRGWLYVSSVYFVHVSWLPIAYWTAVFDRFLFPLALASHWLEEFANCTPTIDKNDKSHAVPPNLSATLEASQLTLSLINSTPLVIVAKNKLLTLTSRPNLALNARNI